MHEMIVGGVPKGGSALRLTPVVQIVLLVVGELPDGLQRLADLPDPRLHALDHGGVTLRAGQCHRPTLGHVSLPKDGQDRGRQQQRRHPRPLARLRSGFCGEKRYQGDDCNVTCPIPAMHSHPDALLPRLDF